MQNPIVSSWGYVYFEEEPYPSFSVSIPSMGPQPSRHSHGEYFQSDMTQSNYSHHPALEAKYHTRPFKCDQCPRSFNRNHDLRRHKRIHLTVKPFPCGYCEKSFSRKDVLKVRRMRNASKFGIV